MAAQQETGSGSQLGWKPCLTREEGGAREHCWYLASTSHDSFFCWQCKAELGL